MCACVRAVYLLASVCVCEREHPDIVTACILLSLGAHAVWRCLSSHHSHARQGWVLVQTLALLFGVSVSMAPVQPSGAVTSGVLWCARCVGAGWDEVG